MVTSVAGEEISRAISTSGVFLDDDAGLGPVGRGQVKSLLPSGQNSLFLSYRYHCLSLDNQLGVTVGGSSLGISLSSCRCLSLVTGLSLVSFRRTIPGH